MEQRNSQVSPEQLAQQQAFKTSKEAFRSRIKALSTHQSQLKNNVLSKPAANDRDNFSLAQQTKEVNRYELKHLYLAYALMRARHGGYTKVPEYRMVSANTHLQSNYHLYHDHFLINLTEKYGPKTVHLNP